MESLEKRHLLATITLASDLIVGSDIGPVSPSGTGTQADPYVYDFAGDDLDMAAFDILGKGLSSFRFEGLGSDVDGHAIKHGVGGGVVNVSSQFGQGGTVEIEAAVGSVTLSSISTSGSDGGSVSIQASELTVDGSGPHDASVNTSASDGNGGRAIFKVAGAVTLAGGIDTSGGSYAYAIIDGPGDDTPAGPIYVGGDINTSGGPSIIRLHGEDIEIAGNVLAHSPTSTEELTIKSPNEVIIRGFIDKSSGYSPSGNILLRIEAGSLAIEGVSDGVSVNTSSDDGYGGGMNISVEDAMDLMGGIRSSGTAGTDGVVTLRAGSEIHIGMLDVDLVDMISFDSGADSHIVNDLLNFDISGSPQLQLDSFGSVYYDSTRDDNSYLNARTYPLNDGGALRPLNRPPEAPTDSDSAANQVNEGAATGTAVGIIASASDPDGDPLTYRLTDDAGGRFAIDADTGVVSAVDGTLLDGPESHSITVEAEDPFGATSTADFEINVNNVEPVVEDSDLLLTNSAIDENGSVTLSGSFTDAGVPDTHSVMVSWGDGTTTPADVSQGAGSGTFTAIHQYLDDNPTATAADDYPILVTVTDDDSGSDTAQTSISVRNVVPVIEAISTSATFETRASEGETVTLSALLSDVGTLDTHSATVNWGEPGGEDESASVIQESGSAVVAASHVYHGGGYYSVTLTVTDDDTGSDSVTTFANVVGVGVNDWGTADHRFRCRRPCLGPSAGQRPAYRPS